MNNEYQKTPFIVAKGRGAASGEREYSNLGGSIRAQKPFFLDRGLSLDGFYPGTINADISPREFRIINPLISLRQIGWHPNFPAEDFSLSPCCLNLCGEFVPGLIYYPHPETKKAFGYDSPRSIIEVLAPKIASITYGSVGEIWTNKRELSILDIHVPT